MHTTTHYTLLSAATRYHQITASKAVKNRLETLAQQHTVENIKERISRLPYGMDKILMPRKNNGFDITFVNVSLSSDQRKELKQWLQTGEYDFGEILQEIMYSDARMTLSYSVEDNKTWASIMTAKDSNSPKKYGFSAYGRDPFSALLSAYYKFKYILELDLSNLEDIDEDYDIG